MFSIFVPKCTGRDPMVLLQRKLYFTKDPEGSNIFQREGGGVQIHISIEPHITCDFRGGGGGGSGPPKPPMDPHINTEAVILIETGV